MGMVRGIRLMNALVSGAISASQLEALLASDERRGEFAQLVSLPGQAAIALSSELAATAIAGSETALDVFLSTPRNLIAVPDYAAAFMSFWNTPRYRSAVFNNNRALSRVLSSNDLLSFVKGHATYSVRSKFAEGQVPVSWTTGVTGGDLDALGEYLVLGVNSNTSRTLTLDAQRSGSSRANSIELSLTEDTTVLIPFIFPWVGPLTSVFSSGNNNPVFIGLVRCDA